MTQEAHMLGAVLMLADVLDTSLRGDSEEVMDEDRRKRNDSFQRTGR